MTIGIAGAGRVAQALGRHLREHGQPVIQVASRSLEHARLAAAFVGDSSDDRVEAVGYGDLACDRVLIAVPDRAIVEVALSIGVTPAKPRTVLHCCGAYGAALLEPLRQQGVSCGALHPLQTFTTAEAGYRALRGCAFAIDGDGDALEWSEEIALMLDGMILRIPEQSRAIYHAATAMASNHVVSVLDAALEMMAQAGVSGEIALRALEPIARTALSNAFAVGPERALTGPVERGDADTLARHVEAIRAMPEHVRELYRAASLQALSIARRRGLESGLAERVEAVLREQHV